MKPTPLDQAALSDHPLPPVKNGDKETKGRILIVAGSRSVPGAALLAANGAMRAGAGKLTIATVQSIAVHIGVAMPEAMVVGLPEAEDGGFAANPLDPLNRLAEKADAIVGGPGLETNDACDDIGRILVASDARIVLDAALLHALDAPSANRASPPLLLPHAGELASLLDCAQEQIEENPVGCGLNAAEHYHSIVLVKGITSYVITPDGQAWLYDGGVPGLGVSGSGDVLAGIVGGLLARGAEPLNALLWAVWLHGEAGSALAEKVGAIGFMAREIAGEIPALLPA